MTNADDSRERVLKVYPDAESVNNSTPMWQIRGTHPIAGMVPLSAWRGSPVEAWADADTHLSSPPAAPEGVQETPQEDSSLAQTLSSGMHTIVITRAHTLEGQRVVAGWEDSQLREFAISWIARAEARKQLADEALQKIAELEAKLSALPVAEPKWIDVKQELPPEGITILAGFQGQFGWVSFTATYYKNTGIHASGYAPPTHWQRLPAPPTERPSND